MEMKFKPGDVVRCEKYGRGTISQVDPKNRDFTFDVHFDEGTVVWLSARWAEKHLTLVKRTAEAA